MPQALVIIGVPGGNKSATFTIPPIPTLVEFVMAIQVADPSTGLSRPVITEFIP